MVTCLRPKRYQMVSAARLRRGMDQQPSRRKALGPRWINGWLVAGHAVHCFFEQIAKDLIARQKLAARIVRVGIEVSF